MDCALCMMIMASIFLSGLGCVVLQACFMGWVGSISYWVGLDWITENEPTSMSARYGFLFAFHSNYGPILYRFRDIGRKSRFFIPSCIRRPR